MAVKKKLQEIKWIKLLCRPQSLRILDLSFQVSFSVVIFGHRFSTVTGKFFNM